MIVENEKTFIEYMRILKENSENAIKNGKGFDIKEIDKIADEEKWPMIHKEEELSGCQIGLYIIPSGRFPTGLTYVGGAFASTTYTHANGGRVYICEEVYNYLKAQDQELLEGIINHEFGHIISCSNNGTEEFDSMEGHGPKALAQITEWMKSNNLSMVQNFDLNAMILINWERAANAASLILTNGNTRHLKWMLANSQELLVNFLRYIDRKGLEDMIGNKFQNELEFQQFRTQMIQDANAENDALTDYYYMIGWWTVNKDLYQSKYKKDGE